MNTDKTLKKLPDNQIVFFRSQDGKINVEVMYGEENVWLSQKKMAELFDTTPQNITQHLKNIYREMEVDEISTCKDFLQVQSEEGRENKIAHGSGAIFYGFSTISVYN